MSLFQLLNELPRRSGWRLPGSDRCLGDTVRFAPGSQHSFAELRRKAVSTEYSWTASGMRTLSITARWFGPGAALSLRRVSRQLLWDSLHGVRLNGTW